MSEFQKAKLPRFMFRMTQTELVKVLEAIACINDEATFNIDENGISTRTMTPDRVAMADVVMAKQIFEEYDYTKETEPLKFAVSLTELLKILRRFGKEDKVTIRSDPDTGKFQISSALRDFSLPMLEPETEENPAPKITLTTEVAITTEAFKSAVQDCALATDHTTIWTTQEGVNFNSKGDLLTAVVGFTRGHEALLKLEGADAKATYNLDILTTIAKHVYSDATRISYATDMPLRLDVEGKAQFTYYLAPRIEED